jgi:hypothetical protein
MLIELCPSRSETTFIGTRASRAAVAQTVKMDRRQARCFRLHLEDLCKALRVEGLALRVVVNT